MPEENPEDHAEEQSPLDLVVDLFVFAPLGLVLNAKEEVARLAAQGRKQMEAQLALAKMFGQFAVAQGEREARRRADRLVAQASETADRLTAMSTVSTRAPAEQAPSAGGNGRGPEPRVDPAGSDERAQTTAAAGSAANARSVVVPATVADLAIPGYDTLSASQVVQRLAGLAAVELEAVRGYEEGTRRRRTILSKVAQLQGSTSAPGQPGQPG